MRTIPLLLALTLTGPGCSGPRTADQPTAAVAEAARPEVRYYIIGDS